MKVAIVTYRTLFHPKNNSSLRMDASIGMMLSKMENGIVDPDPHHTIKNLFTNSGNWKSWLNSLHKKTTLEEIKAHIKSAFTGTKAKKNSKLSAKVEKGIHHLAIGLCNQEAKVLEATIAKQLFAIKQLRDMATYVPKLKTIKTGNQKL